MNIYSRLRKHINDILNGNRRDMRGALIFRVLISVLIIIDIAVVILSSGELGDKYPTLSSSILYLSGVIFLVEYGLRIWIAPLHRKDKLPTMRYMLSFFGLMDLISIIPFVLPAIITKGSLYDEVIDVFCVFLIFKIARYSRSFDMVASVFRNVRAELFMAMSMALILVAFSGGVMYFVERDAQPEVFDNIGQGFWWAIITFTTVGYGDIYPITPVGKVLASMIALVGIGMIALPTGIMCSAFLSRINSKVHSQKVETNDEGYCPHCGAKLDKSIETNKNEIKDEQNKTD